MSSKLLSVKETREQLKRKISPFVWDEKDAYGFDIFIANLISAVRREQDLIATKRERKRAVNIINPYDFASGIIIKKILEEK